MGSCIRGEPAEGLKELFGPGGVGKCILGERRIPKEEALRQLYEISMDEFPETANIWAGDGLPAVRGPCIVFVPDVRAYPDIDDWLLSLDDDVIVICAQEICHQVTAHFRMH